MTTVESVFFAGQCSWIIRILMVRCGAISLITDFVALQCNLRKIQILCYTFMGT